jgi:hypothetical protein
MIRNIDKKHRFRVADEGGHGHMGSSEVPTPKLPKDHKIPHGMYGSYKPRGSPAKSCAKVTPPTVSWRDFGTWRGKLLCFQYSQLPF